ncbi:MAG: YveK family protein [Acetivibrionales bacterium]
MGLRDFFIILHKKIWLILLLPIMAGGISAYISFKVIEPVYESSMTLYILNKEDGKASVFESGDYLASQQLIKDFSEIIRSKSVIRELIEECRLTGEDPVEIAERINIRFKNDTRLIEISIRYSSPEDAKGLTEAVSRIFIEKLGNLINIENIEIIDSAELPEHPVKPNITINLTIAVIGGFVTALGLVFLLHHMDDTVKTVEDIEIQLGLIVLAIIPSHDIK